MKQTVKKISCRRIPQKEPFIPKPAATVDIVVRDGQVSEVYARRGAVQVNVLDLDTDEPHRRARLQKQYALLLKLAASGEITDIF